MSKNPPAFPYAAIGPSGDLYEQEGMSLRDWFAGQVASGFVANPTWMAGVSKIKGVSITKTLADASYEIADAMLLARLEGEEA